MNQKYPVKLTEAERYQLKQILSSGTTSVRKVRRAQILLKSDSSPEGPNWSYQAICQAFDVSQPTISDVRRAYADGGLEAAINRKKPDRVYKRRLDGEAEAHLIALVCGEPPEGYDRWTLRLLKTWCIGRSPRTMTNDPTTLATSCLASTSFTIDVMKVTNSLILMVEV